MMSTGKKIQRILRVFLVFFLLICLRIWHLGVIQREERLQEAEKPQQKTLLIRADRGVIVDRFGIPLAVNRISYNAAIYYAQIAEIPRISWQTGPDRKQVKIFLGFLQFGRSKWLHCTKCGLRRGGYQIDLQCPLDLRELKEFFAGVFQP